MPRSLTSVEVLLLPKDSSEAGTVQFCSLCMAPHIMDRLEQTASLLTTMGQANKE
jgi:hypothetical protein